MIRFLESLSSWGGVKRDVVFLILSGLALAVSLIDPTLFPIHPAWAAILLCGVPILLEAVIGLVTAFDIKADVLVSLALLASVAIGEIFAANLGGAATMSGDPPNIIIGTSLGLSFWDFLRNNGVICLIGLVLVLVYFYLCFRSKSRGEAAVAPELWEIDPNDAIPSRRRFLARVSIFGVVILLIATHTLTGLTMPTIGVLAAAVTLVSTKTPQNLVRQMDWKILGFIIGLFLTVSGLEQTGVLDGMAQFLAALGGDHADQMVVVLIWFTAIVSAFVDNIPMATVMVPVLLSLAETLGMDLHTLTWAVSKGTDIGGIATPIGASANVTGVALAAKEGHPISWKRYCKYAMPAAVLVLVVSMVLILALH